MSTGQSSREPDLSRLPAEVARELRYRRQLAYGEVAAYQFVWEVNADPERIQEEIGVVQSRITNPRHLGDIMKPGTSTRIYQDGYLAGLTTAFRIITGSASCPGTD